MATCDGGPKACLAAPGGIFVTKALQAALGQVWPIEATLSMPWDLRTKLAWVGVVAGISCLVCISFVDRPLALLMHSYAETPIVEFARKTTSLGQAKWYLVAALLAFVILRCLKIKERANQAILLFLAVAVSGIAVDILKHVFGRARPKLLFSEHEYGFGYFRGDRATISFPSGHATTIAAVAVTIALLAPRWRMPALVVALWIGATRVLINAHYLSDVIAGFYLGALTAIWLAHIFQHRVRAAKPLAAA